jgi:hypothetical protein
MYRNKFIDLPPAGLILIVVGMAGAAVLKPEWFFRFSAVLIGALAVGSLVSWIGRRDDPRHTKRPTDEP